MPDRCFVEGCPIGKLSVRKEYLKMGKKHPAIFGAPLDPAVFEEWKKVIPQKHRIFTADHRICQLHFNEKDIVWFDTVPGPSGNIIRKRRRPILRSGVVPSSFPNGSNVSIKTKVMPRPSTDAFSSLHFTLLKAPNNKYNAFCNVCKKTLCNTAAARLRAHRNRCRLETESSTFNHTVPTSLITSHDYTKNFEPPQIYYSEEETQSKATNVYSSDSRYDDLDVDMRIVGVENAAKDECAAFGHYVATQLRKMDTKTCALVRFKICETLFNAEMGNLSKDSDT